MFCPILKAARVVAREDGLYAVDCREAECAWWVKECGACAVVAITGGVDYVWNELSKLAAKGK